MLRTSTQTHQVNVEDLEVHLVLRKAPTTRGMQVLPALAGLRLAHLYCGLLATAPQVEARRAPVNAAPARLARRMS